MVRKLDREVNSQAVERVAQKYNVRKKDLCNALFKEVGKGKTRRDKCLICELLLPKLPYHKIGFIDYEQQIDHIVNCHTIAQIEDYIYTHAILSCSNHKVPKAETIYSTTNIVYDSKTNNLEDFMREFEGKLIEIKVRIVEEAEE